MPASAVPLRPSKLRLKERRLTAPDPGAAPIPIHGPHAVSRRRAPAPMMSDRAPLAVIISSIWREPGDIMSAVSGWTVLPATVAATVIMSL